MENSASDKTEPIAVIGIGCRFPGDATSPEALWDMLLRGGSAWSEFPEDRINISTYYHPSGTRQGTICFQGAHFLKQNVAAFDSSFFGIPPEEAKAVDPQQRMLLEVTVEALDSAGIDRNAIRKSETGVWIGSFVKDYEQIVLRDYDDQPQYGATGNGTAIMSNRLSYFLDVNGPSMTIDTGCSASLVCVHQACQSLLTRESDMALAGGSGLILTPNTMMPMTALNFLSPDGRSYTFDARANGYGRGEGVGIVVLKRLSDAIRDNDNIRAVIRNTRLNQDGRTPGITLPGTEAQIRNMRAIYERAGLDATKTAYVECHGTGTQAGDVRELRALSESISKRRTTDDPIFVGSIKTNVGHLEGGAGIAGLIKGILVAEHGTIPKHINFRAPGNPAIEFKAWKVKVATENTPWPVPGLRRVSVNSFGFGGTNAHAILDDAAHYLSERGLCASHSTTLLDEFRDPSISYQDLAATVATVKHWRREISLHAWNQCMPYQNLKSHVFVFSAHDIGALVHMLEAYAKYFSERLLAFTSLGGFMEDLAYTLGCRRTKLQWRAAITATSVEELATKLQTEGKASMVRASEDKTVNVAFVFSGQGSQWHAMGRELLGFDIYLESIAAASRYMTDKLKANFCLLAELLKDKDTSRINAPEISQPATTALQVALVDFLVHHCGVVPSSVVGHSSGEIAAAYASGTISRTTAWELAYYRGLWAASLHQLADGESMSQGRMLAVGLSDLEAAHYVDQVGRSRVKIACINSPASVTLSGDVDAILELQTIFEGEDVFNRLLTVDIAYHSHHMLSCAPGYRRSIAHLLPREPVRRILRHPHSRGRLLSTSDLPLESAEERPISKSGMTKMISSVTGAQVEWQYLTHLYWLTNLLSPVHFSDAISAMMHPSDGKRPDIVVEIGPHVTLRSPLQQIFEGDPTLREYPEYISLLHRNADATTTALEAIGKLWSRGCNIAMPWVVMRNAQFRRPKPLPNLPNYPWNHEVSHWYESHLSRANRLMPHGRYDLIGRPTADSIPFQPRWRGFFRVKENPWIEHHQVQKTIIYPAAGMVSMVLEGAKQLAPDSVSGIEISRFKIEKAMLIPLTDHGLEYALNFNKQESSRRRRSLNSIYLEPCAELSTSYEFFIYSKPLDGSWQQHGSGIVTIHRESVDDQRAKESMHLAKNYHQKYLSAADACDDPIIPRQLYETLDVIGMNYGPIFQNITSLYKRDSQCTFVVRIPDTRSIMPAKFEYSHILHPATLDSVFQTAFSFGNSSMVPSYIGSIYVSMNSNLPSGAGSEFVGFATAERQGLREAKVTFIMSDKSWKGTGSQVVQDPLVIIKDMKFTTLSTNADFNASSFLPNHHNLCSEIIWEPAPQTEANCSMDRKNRITGRAFLLVPETMGSSLTQLCNQLCAILKCTSLTLDQLRGGESYPAYCISLLEALSTNHVVWDWSENDFSMFRNLFDSTQGLLWITQGAQVDSKNPKSSLFQALARTIRSESPQKDLVTFDIDSNSEVTTAITAETIARVFLSAFLTRAKSDPKETDYTERNGQLLVPRLVPIPTLNNVIERGNTPEQPMLVPLSQQNRCLKLRIREIGNVDSLYWDDDQTAAKPFTADVVTINVLGTGLSGLDINIVMGDTHDHALGTDAYGIIAAVGDNVQELRVGDHVIAIARGTFRQQIRCHRSLVQKVSEDTDPSIVLLPTPLAMAHYGLYTLASLKHCHFILVHEGAGTFGRAAVRLAQHVGATVIATYTNNKQRNILKNDYHLPSENIFESNDSNLVESIMRLTHGAGVNVVFDPTSDNRESNCRCVANSGHIISLTSKNMVKGQVADFTGKTFSISIIDIAFMIKKEPWRLGESFKFLCTNDIRRWFPQYYSTATQYDWAEIPRAFGALVEDNLCGMIYCVPSENTKLPVMPQRKNNAKDYLRSDCTYVLAGQGGLGMHIARMLAVNGVKNIALLSRSGAVSTASQSAVAFLEGRGVNTKVLKVDICDKAALENAVKDIETNMPPIRGIFQCAATIRDGIFDTMTYESWQSAVKPKTVGSWNLYHSFPQNMDFFIFLSSSVGIIGNRGQANYATGNAFQDALARHINSKGIMRSVSIDLGPVLGAGMLAEDPRTLDKLKATGFFGIRLEDFERVIERAITGYTEGSERIPPQVVMGVGTGGLIRQNNPADPYWTRTALFTHMNKVDMPANDNDHHTNAELLEKTTKFLLSTAETIDEAQNIVNLGLCTVLAISMGKQAEDVDEGRPPSAYGVDSLVAVNIRSWIYKECEVEISIFEILSDTSIADLSATIIQRGGFGKYS